MDRNTTRAYCTTLVVWSILQLFLSVALFLVNGHTNAATAALFGSGTACGFAAAWFGRHL